MAANEASKGEVANGAAMAAFLGAGIGAFAMGLMVIGGAVRRARAAA